MQEMEITQAASKDASQLVTDAAHWLFGFKPNNLLPRSRHNGGAPLLMLCTMDTSKRLILQSQAFLTFANPAAVRGSSFLHEYSSGRQQAASN